MPRTSPSFIRALVDDASFNPFFSSLLELKRQRVASDLPVLERQDRAPLRLIEPAEQIRERAA